MDRVWIASDVPDPSSLPAMGGLYGLLLTVGLALAVILLYRSMRHQMKKIDFDPDGTTDAERMAGADRDVRTAKKDSEVNGYHERPPQV